MKSIVEEASSISKAIDQAWQRAGKPSEFKIKVFEEPERNMFGLTVKSAKIGLFYEEQSNQSQTFKPKEAPHKHVETRTEPKRAEPRAEIKRPEVRPEPRKAEARKLEPRQETRQNVKPDNQSENKDQPNPEKRPRVIWDEDMANSAREWVRHNLTLIGHPNVEFTATIVGNNLRFQFNTMITGDANKERLLFSSFAYLILSTLRNKYNKPLPHLRVVLKSS